MKKAVAILIFYGTTMLTFGQQVDVRLQGGFTKINMPDVVNVLYLQNELAAYPINRNFKPGGSLQFMFVSGNKKLNWLGGASLDYLASTFLDSISDHSVLGGALTGFTIKCYSGTYKGKTDMWYTGIFTGLQYHPFNKLMISLAVGGRYNLIQNVNYDMSAIVEDCYNHKKGTISEHHEYQLVMNDAQRVEAFSMFSIDYKIGSRFTISGITKLSLFGHVSSGLPSGKVHRWVNSQYLLGVSYTLWRKKDAAVTGAE